MHHLAVSRLTERRMHSVPAGKKKHTEAGYWAWATKHILSGIVATEEHAGPAVAVGSLCLPCCSLLCVASSVSVRFLPISKGLTRLRFPRAMRVTMSNEQSLYARSLF